MIELTDEMVKKAVDTFLAAPNRNIGEIDATMRAVLTEVLVLAEPKADDITVTVSAHDLRAVLAYGNGHCHMRPATWDRNGLPCNECLALGRLAMAVQLATVASNA